VVSRGLVGGMEFVLVVEQGNSGRRRGIVANHTSLKALGTLLEVRGREQSRIARL